MADNRKHFEVDTRHRSGKANLLFVLVALVAVAAICVGYYKWRSMRPEAIAARQNRNTDLCKRNLTVLGQAFAEYVSDSDGTLPLSENWQDALAPYAKKVTPKGVDPFVCPSVAAFMSTSSGYALNSEVAGKRVFDPSVTLSTVLVFDSKDVKRNASGLDAENTADPRHSGKVNRLYVGGIAGTDGP